MGSESRNPVALETNHGVKDMTKDQATSNQSATIADATQNLVSQETFHSAFATTWHGPWVGDVDGLYETRATVTACKDGFLPGLELSYCGGEPRECHAALALSTLAAAIQASMALEQTWHHNNADLH
jgi:hypothetical protein